jgi:hypothetical protein
MRSAGRILMDTAMTGSTRTMMTGNMMGRMRE